MAIRQSNSAVFSVWLTSFYDLATDSLNVVLPCDGYINSPLQLLLAVVGCTAAFAVTLDVKDQASSLDKISVAHSYAPTSRSIEQFVN